MAVEALQNKREINKMKRALHGRNRALFVLGVSMGLRISDLLTLKFGDIRDKQTLEIVEGKTGKPRVITISDTVRKEIAKLDGGDDDYIFASRKRNADGTSKPISRVQAYRILRAGAKRAGLDVKIGTHSLRKTFGRILHENGVPLSRIMVILNHSSEAITARYIGITAEEIAEAYEAIEI